MNVPNSDVLLSCSIIKTNKNNYNEQVLYFLKHKYTFPIQMFQNPMKFVETCFKNTFYTKYNCKICPLPTFRLSL